ncbi:hypothetical protein BDN70DRAFT_821289, partial [Pholiota conissans]
IENVWTALKRIVHSAPHPPTSTKTLIAAVHKAWDTLEVSEIDKYIHSMPSRVAAILKAHGGPTRY